MRIETANIQCKHDQGMCIDALSYANHRPLRPKTLQQEAQAAMSNLTEMFNAGAANAYLFVPSAILLGALHGLEPGHSKTMMAAFIVAIRGTVTQAVMLGIAATVSHTAVVWAVALTGLYFGSRWSAEAGEPYLQIASGALILGVALWMIWRSWREHRPPAGHAHAHAHAAGDHGHDHPHPHQSHHHRNFGHHRHEHPQPHPRHGANKETAFKQDLLLVDPQVFASEHEREHAIDINRRFSDGRATTGQIILFGLTGGLIPCPASITVLLLCLQVGKISLGALLVLCFSLGLAITMVLVGVGAALSLRHVSARWKGFDAFAARAPYVSGALVALVGIYTLYLGVASLA
jgi:nickel/cobalt exporter